MKVSIDSRTIQPGEYFIPVRGKQFDGRDFINDALSKGGVLLDVDLSAYAKQYRKKLKCPVIAITGSAGKTTVKELLSHILSQRFSVVKTHENENNEIGVPLTLLKADVMTDILIVEMGIRHKGEMTQMTRIVRPTHVIVTGVGLSHASQLGGPKNIAYAKSEIFMPALQWEVAPRKAYINCNTPHYAILQRKAEKAGYAVYPYSGEDKPDENLNVCYLIARQFGLTDTEIRRGIDAYKPASHRLTPLQLGAYCVIDDTYNANPDGVIYALQYLKQFSGRKIVILGDMLELGDYSESAHKALVPHMLEASVSVVFTFGKESACLSSDTISVDHFNTKEALHQALVAELKPGDVVLVKGSRKMTMESCIKVIKEHVGIC